MSSVSNIVTPENSNFIKEIINIKQIESNETKNETLSREFLCV